MLSFHLYIFTAALLAILAIVYLHNVIMHKECCAQIDYLEDYKRELFEFHDQLKVTWDKIKLLAEDLEKVPGRKLKKKE